MKQAFRGAMAPELNIDAGEYDDEPPALYALAHRLNVACGGHAGDDASMRRVVRACLAHGTQVGAHPSYADREGFGRRDVEVPNDVLEAQVYGQCARLAAIAGEEGVAITSAKLHGALYHAAHRDRAVAEACLRGIARALGRITIVGLARGALGDAARAQGHRFLVEAFADRGVRPDGSLVPRGEPGALVHDPAIAAARARALRDEGVDTICVHGDTPSAVAIARAVRDALESGDR